MPLEIGEEQFEGGAVMSMGHEPSRNPPEPFNAVGIRIISRRIHQVYLLLQLGEHGAYQQGASRGVGLEIVVYHDCSESPLFGTGHGSTHLLTEHLGHRTSHHASLPGQSRKLCGYPQGPRPGVARVALCNTRRASASDGRPPASHLAGTSQHLAPARATLPGQREADSTDQPRLSHAQVEVRLLWCRLTAPLPSGVSHVILFLGGLAPQRPGGPLTDVPMRM